jgi:hypothetical protein
MTSSNRQKLLNLPIPPAALALLAFTALFVLYFSPVICSGQLMLPDDDFKQNLPSFLGQRFLWTNFVYSGFPQAADPLVQTWYPISFLFQLLPLPLSWNLYLIAGYILTAFFVYLFVVELTGKRFAGMAAGIVFSLSGCIVASVRHPHFTHWSFTLVATLLIIEKLRKSLQNPAAPGEAEGEAGGDDDGGGGDTSGGGEKGSEEKPVPIAKFTPVSYLGYRPLALTVLGAWTMGLMVLNGHVQVLAYALLLIACYTLFCAAGMTAHRLRFCVCVAIFTFLGLSLGTVQLAPTWELTHFSARAKFTFEDFLTYSLSPFQMLGLIVPFVTGGLSAPFFGMRYFGPNLAPPAWCYLGILPLTLLTLSTTLIRKHRQIVFWLCVWLFTFLLAFGNSTPLAWLFYHAPLLGMFRNLNRFYFITVFATAVICGLTLALIEQAEIDSETVAKNSLTMIVLVAIVLYLDQQLLQFDSLRMFAARVGAEQLIQTPWLNPALIAAFTSTILSLLAITLWQINPRGAKSRALLLTVLVADLGLTGAFFEWRQSGIPVASLKTPASALQIKPVLDRLHERVLATRGGSGTPAELPCNLSKSWEIPNASGYQPLMITRYGTMLDMTEGGFLQVPWTFKAQNRAFDLLSVRYLTCAKGDNRLEAYEQDGRKLFKKFADVDTATIYENERVLPRCWLVNRTIRLTPEEILRTIQSGKLPDGSPFVPTTTALVENEQEGEKEHRKEFSERSPDDVARIEKLENETVDLRVRCQSDKFLVLSDIFYPGWQATIDGKPAAILCTDYLLRGVEIPKGDHQVEFRFESRTIQAGAAVSLATLILLLYLSFSAIRQRRADAT